MWNELETVCSTCFFCVRDDGSEDFVGNLDLIDYQEYPVSNLLNRKNMYQKISFIIKEIIYCRCTKYNSSLKINPA